jgi:hypothetical protein
MTNEQLQAWADGARAAGDTETHLVARIALGDRLDLSDYRDALTAQQLLMLRDLTPERARAMAGRWGAPDRAEMDE